MSVHLAELGGHAKGTALQDVALAAAIHDAFVAAAVVTGIGVVTSLVRGPTRRGATDVAG